MTTTAPAPPACPWRIRWAPGHISDCTKAEHVPGDIEHSGMAMRGSPSVLTWYAGDRREFTGDWPGNCTGQRGLCVLPAGHPRSCQW